MTVACPRCGHVRNGDDDLSIPDGVCPMCGVVFAKYGRQPALPSSSPDDIGSGEMVIDHKAFMRRMPFYIAAVVALLLGYSYLSPKFAIGGIRNALIEGDTEALNDYVDFNRLRTNVKMLVEAETMARMTELLKDNPFAAFGVAFASKMVDAAVDSMISPKGLMAFFNLQKDKEKLQPVNPLLLDVELEYQSFNRVYVAQENGTQIAFERVGPFSWKVVDIIPPKQKAKKGENGQ